MDGKMIEIDGIYIESGHEPQIFTGEPDCFGWVARLPGWSPENVETPAWAELMLRCVTLSEDPANSSVVTPSFDLTSEASVTWRVKSDADFKFAAAGSVAIEFSSPGVEQF